MINLILQWVAVILLLIIALGLTFGWFWEKKQTGCNCCEFKETCSKNKRDC